MFAKSLMIVTVWTVGVVSLAFGKHENNRITFANYHSYMDEDIIDELQDKYQIKAYYFDSDEIVVDKMSRGTYDISVVSSSILEELICQQKIQKIDWQRFTGREVETKTKRQSKFIEIFSKSFPEITCDNGDSVGELLDYGIPYFAGKYSFYYRGQEIGSLKTKVSWKELIDIISKEERFQFNGRARLGMVEDSRTINSVIQMVHKKDINEPNDQPSLNLPKMLLSPDSALMVNALASSAINGAFMYNGDALFAFEGGDEEHHNQSDDFHMVELEQELYFMDFVVLSNKLVGDKLQVVYEAINELLLWDDDSKVDQNPSLNCKGAIKNFYYSYYTTPLKKFYDKLITSGLTGACQEDDPESTTNQQEETKIKEIIKLNNDDYKIEHRVGNEKMQNIVFKHHLFKGNMK